MDRLTDILIALVVIVTISIWFLHSTLFVLPETSLTNRENGDFWWRNHDNLSNHKKVKTFYPDTRDINYIANNESICGSGDVSLIYLVSSATDHFDRRRQIRSTFANGSYFKNDIVKVAFFVGKTDNATLQNGILAEHRKYGDVIQVAFWDTYRNLTLKVVAQFDWITKYCPGTVGVAKIDDDTFVDTYKVLTIVLPKLVKGEHHLQFYCLPHYPMQIERDGKWDLERDELKYYRTFPWPFCSGLSVIFKASFVSRLLKSVLISPFLWVDDVYFSGVLPSRMKYLLVHKNVMVRKEGRRKFLKYVPPPCFLNETCNTLFAIAPLELFADYWNFIVNVRYRGLII